MVGEGQAGRNGGLEQEPEEALGGWVRLVLPRLLGSLSGAPCSSSTPRDLALTSGSCAVVTQPSLQFALPSAHGCRHLLSAGGA